MCGRLSLSSYYEKILFSWERIKSFRDFGSFLDKNEVVNDNNAGCESGDRISTEVQFRD